VARPARGGGDRGDDRLALGLARVRRARVRGPPGGAGADARFARPTPEREDRPSRRALAGTPARERDAAAVLDPPEQIQQLRDRTRLRKALAEDRRRWGQRLHAYLLHEGWPCSRSNLLRPPGLRWAAALQLPEHARLQVDSLLAVMATLQEQLDTVDGELRRFARADERCQALQSIYGVGPILACHLLAEIGEASRFQRAEQITRLAGLDPVVDESGESRRRGHLAKAGSPHLRWALVEAAVHAHRPTAPDLALYRATRQRRDTTVARLTIARKIGKRAFRLLRELELTAA